MPKKLYRNIALVEAHQADVCTIVSGRDGTYVAEAGDYILTDVDGEQRPMKRDVFERTHVAVCLTEL